MPTLRSGRTVQAEGEPGKKAWYLGRVPLGFVLNIIGGFLTYHSTLKWLLWLGVMVVIWVEVGQLRQHSSSSKKVNIVSQIAGNLFGLFDLFLVEYGFQHLVADRQLMPDDIVFYALVYMWYRSIAVLSIMFLFGSAYKDMACYCYLLNCLTCTCVFWSLADPLCNLTHVLVIASSDAFQYFAGRKYGKKKIVPEVSPNKTLEGYIGGTVLVHVVAAVYIDFSWFSEVWLLGTILAGILGDLAVSSWKRFHAKKDTSDLFASHGGMLDRLDSHLGAWFFTLHFIALTQTPIKSNFTYGHGPRLLLATSIVWVVIWIRFFRGRK